MATTTAMVAPGPGLGRGFYWGVGAGASIPTYNLRGAYGTGWNVTVPLGWSPAPESPIGFRVDLSYDRFNVSSGNFDDGGTGIGGPLYGYSSGASSPWAASAMADVTWKIPFSYRAAFYLLGGVGVHYFKWYAGNPAFNYDCNGAGSGTMACSGALTPVGNSAGLYAANYTNGFYNSNGSSTRFGLNGGAGLSFGFAGADLFVESRFVNAFMGSGNNFNGSGNFNTNWVPIIVGVTFR